MAIISKIRLINFKRFRDYTVTPNENMNIFVGDNESGKSSILEAIDMVACGNARRVENTGLEKIMNIDAVHEFLDGARKYENLPKVIVELYLSGEFPYTMNGKNNTDKKECDGIRMVCEPRFDYVSEINASMVDNEDYFPFDYYFIRFSTFADEAYTGYKRKLRSIKIDSSITSSEYATNDFVNRMYLQYTAEDVKERAKHKSLYRKMRNEYCKTGFKEMNDQIPEEKNYSFGLKSGSSAELDKDLMLYEDNISIDNKGTGKQIFIKTDFALEHAGNNVDVILIEEPETHLSHTNLRKLLKRVSDSSKGQIFVTTHNSLISTRLELSNLLILHEGSESTPTALNDLDEETVKYFKKAPPANIIEFALSKSNILVEGPSEYMLMENFYKSITGKLPDEDNINIMTVRGLSFKRYLNIAALTGAKVAVITDNDKDYVKNCENKYKDYKNNDNIKAFYEKDNTKSTFEIVLNDCNRESFNEVFGENAEKYMLNNKTEAAYTLLESGHYIKVPKYIEEAIKWINE